MLAAGALLAAEFAADADRGLEAAPAWGLGFGAVRGRAVVVGGGAMGAGADASIPGAAASGGAGTGLIDVSGGAGAVSDVTGAGGGDGAVAGGFVPQAARTAAMALASIVRYPGLI